MWNESCFKLAVLLDSLRQHHLQPTSVHASYLTRFLLLASACGYCFSAVSIRCVESERGARFLLHLLQLCPKQWFKSVQFEKYLTLTENGDSTPQTFPVIVSIHHPPGGAVVSNKFPSRCIAGNHELLTNF